MTKENILNKNKIVAWGVTQGNQLYAAFLTRKEARGIKKVYEEVDNKKFKLVKLTFDSFVR